MFLFWKVEDLKGLSQEMDLAFGDILWLALGLNRWRGHCKNFSGHQNPNPSRETVPLSRKN